MSIVSIVGWLLCGLLVGLLARFLVPGQQGMGIIQTSILGIVGAVVGGGIYSLLLGSPETTTSLSSDNWYGWLVSIFGAIFVLWIWSVVASRRNSTLETPSN